MNHHIFDTQFNGMGGSTMYRSWIFPELYPHEKPALLQNWEWDDLVAYCGGDYIKADINYGQCPVRILKGVE